MSFVAAARLECVFFASEKKAMPNRPFDDSPGRAKPQRKSIFRHLKTHGLLAKSGKKSLSDVMSEALQLTLAAVLLVAAVAVVFFDLAMSIHDLALMANAGSHSIEENLSSAVINDDVDEIRHLLEMERVRGDHQVFIRTQRGQFYSNGDSEILNNQISCVQLLCLELAVEDVSKIVINPGRLTSIQTISDRTHAIGNLYLSYSLKPIYRRTAVLILFFVFSAILGFIWARQFSQRSVRRLHDLFSRFIQVTREISQREDFSLRVRRLSGFRVNEIDIVELEELAAEFDRMIDRIEVRDQFLEVMNKDLEERVEQRTQDLALERLKSVESARLASLGEMASGIAHEINNPLAIIKASAEQILSLKVEDDGEELGQRARAGVERINKVTDRISKIISGLRTFARDGRFDEFESITVDRLVADTLDFCMARFKNHGVQLLHDQIEKGISLNCRQVQVSQVLLNLLNNSFDALTAAATAYPIVSIECLESQRFIELIVSDNGPGIPVEIRDKVLLPFFTTKEVGKGTGLGLSISRSIMADHGGELIVGSPERGTRIIMRFPKPLSDQRSKVA